MFIVDKEIKKMCENHELIFANYQEKNVGAISYDLTLRSIIGNHGIPHEKFKLKPNRTVFVSTFEILKIPDNFVGIIAEKNSVMREGLSVSAPIYQPSHKTRVFLRVQNVSKKAIVLGKGKNIAQILFSRLSDTPDRPYSQNPTAHFNNEYEFSQNNNIDFF